MVSRKLLGVWAALDFFLLAAGAVSLALSIVWRAENTLMNLVLAPAYLTNAISIIIIGTFIWFFTLQMRNNFHVRWEDASREIRIKLQDQLKCCGYFNGTDLVEIGGNFCQSTEFVAGLNASEATNFCVQPITQYADMTLNNVFTQEDERFKKIDAKRGGRGFV
ncbi:hypothetical protein DXG03_005021 [Asterophora parasitica]|uniref:Tetraspanin n=1 Tax=Asterophora parasitica TaxID=117018 RepID=A0A9P7GAB2_9AGAR|nr:hypothetical protein DXG03_005021 [Asterophora parasitica]